MAIKEAKVKRAIEKYMDSKGYKKKDSRELHETGIDLVFQMRRGGRYYWVEAKGDSLAKNKMEHALIHGLGQLVTKFRKHPNHFFCLAVPASWERRALRKVNLDAMKALNLVLFFVHENGDVVEVGKRGLQRRKIQPTVG